MTGGKRRAKVTCYDNYTVAKGGEAREIPYDAFSSRSATQTLRVYGELYSSSWKVYSSTSPDNHAVIEGFTDNRGSAAYNMKLSQRRADAVRKYLVEKFGVNAEKLSAKGFGKGNPIASNKTKAGRQKNRRVELHIKPLK